MNYKIAVIDGDGIGPEVVSGAIAVLDAVGKRYGHSFEYSHVLMGGAAIDATGVPLPNETVKACGASAAVLFGAVGGPKWDTLPGKLRPEAGLLAIRKKLGLFVNLRPARLYAPLKEACPLKASIRDKGIDIMIVRELSGGMYFGRRNTIQKPKNENTYAYDTEKYSVKEIERVARFAYGLARVGKKKMVSVDKANVLDSSRLWRKTVHELNAEYPDVEVSDMLVDNAAMQLVRDPSRFDVLLTSNMFGDILSDEAGMVTGSIGLLASASLGVGSFGLYEPIHGSAPNIAGQDKANPIAAILSAAMLLRLSLKLDAEAASVESAVEAVLADGFRTADILAEGCTLAGCGDMSRLISKKILQNV